MRRKFPSLTNALQARVKTGRQSFGYVHFLATVVNELYDLNLDECFYAFASRPSAMSEEERHAYDTCMLTNEIIFGYILPSGDCNALSKIAFYVLDQGLRANISRDFFQNEANANITEAQQAAP